jgi:hypothetical protein
VEPEVVREPIAGRDPTYLYIAPSPPVGLLARPVGARVQRSAHFLGRPVVAPHQQHACLRPDSASYIERASRVRRTGLGMSMGWCCKFQPLLHCYPNPPLVSGETSTPRACLDSPIPEHGSPQTVFLVSTPLLSAGEAQEGTIIPLLVVLLGGWDEKQMTNMCAKDGGRQYFYSPVGSCV